MRADCTGDSCSHARHVAYVRTGQGSHAPSSVACRFLLGLLDPVALAWSVYWSDSFEGGQESAAEMHCCGCRTRSWSASALCCAVVWCAVFASSTLSGHRRNCHHFAALFVWHGCVLAQRSVSEAQAPSSPSPLCVPRVLACGTVGEREQGYVSEWHCLRFLASGVLSQPYTSPKNTKK